MGRIPLCATLMALQAPASRGPFRALLLTASINVDRLSKTLTTYKDQSFAFTSHCGGTETEVINNYTGFFHPAPADVLSPLLHLPMAH